MSKKVLRNMQRQRWRFANYAFVALLTVLAAVALNAIITRTLGMP